MSDAREPATLGAVLGQVRGAFADVPRAGTRLRETAVLDRYGSDAARAAARALHTDGHWWDLPDELLDGRAGCSPHFLDAAGLHYAFPALLSWFVRGGSASDTPGAGAAVIVLRSVGTDQERFAGWTPAQAQAVLACLAFLIETEGDRHGHGDDYLTAHEQWTVFAHLLQETAHA